MGCISRGLFMIRRWNFRLAEAGQGGLGGTEWSSKLESP
jgi:hypothetical protein